VGDLDSFADSEVLMGQVARLERTSIKSRVALAAAKAAQKAAEIDLESAEKRLSVYEAATAQTSPKWLSPKRPKKTAATAVVMLSDTHWDEVVNLNEVAGVNKYDRRIAEMRLKRFVDKTIALGRDYIAGGPVEIDSLVLLLGGDMVSGDIHEELTESNEGTMLETVMYWTSQLQAAVMTLADHYGRVHVACVVGNHGRRTRKSRSKRRVHDNFDWMIYQTVARLTEKDERITWQIPEAASTQVKVHNTTLLLTHGDMAKGGGGTGGVITVLKRLGFRLNANPQTKHDILCIGHFHQLVLAPSAGWVLNGSPKGFDEYAATNGFEIHEQDTAQAFFLVTPEHGVTVAAPVFTVDRKAEGW
jgi:hypothetical protein